MAQLLGIHVSWYCDLEQHNDELISTLTLAQAASLAGVLGVPLRELLSEGNPATTTIAIAQLPERIRARIAQEGLSVEEFEDRVGWELGKFLQSPTQLASDSPLMFLKDLAAALEVDWLSLVPEAHAV
jgi:transcriptional regulator with XRE-family HTH domain